MKNFFFLAINNLRRRKMRAWLTMLGIFIGVAAVVALISLGQGLQDYINIQFEQLGKDKIIVMPKSLGSPGSATSSKLILTTKDLETIENVRGVEWAIGILTKQGISEFKKENSINYLIGINPDDMELLSEIQTVKILEGRNLKEGDKYKVVIGYNHAYGSIWKRGIEVGGTMQIEGVDFKVIGIFDKVGNPIDDGQIYVTKEVLKEILNTGEEESQIIVKVDSGFDAAGIADDVKRKLRRERGEREGEETFSIQTAEQLLETFQNIFGVVQAVLVGIAGISLLVGGIGIMNTMYTAVLERTKEIGTMKAVGAKNSDILTIFLIESGLLGTVGGLIGVGLGIGLAKSAEYIAGVYLGSPLLKASMNPAIIIGALLFSFLVGSFSGLLPAMQAARLKPVDALRYE